MSPEKKLPRFIAANIFAMAGMSCYILADTFFISSAAGADGITALNLVLPIYGLIFAIGAMTGAGSATRFSLSRVSGNKNAGRYFSNAVFSVLIISLPFMAAGAVCPGRILTIMGADSRIAALAEDYLRIVLMFTPCFMLNHVVSAFVRNDGVPSVAMAATLAGSFSNIFLDWLFMFPLEMGMPGAALATGISPVMGVGICSLHFLSKKNTLSFEMKPPSVRLLINSCRLGTAAFVAEISSSITVMLFNFVLLELGGNTAVAAYGIIANVSLVATAILNGAAQGLQPPASEAHGSGNIGAEKKIFRMSLIIGISAAVIITVILQVSAPAVTGVFNSEGSAVLKEYAVRGMRIYSSGFVFAAVNIVSAGFFAACDKGRESSVIAVSRGLAAISLFALTLPRFMGLDGVWLAFPAAEAATFFITLKALREN